MDPAEQLRILETELGTYQPELLERPRLVTGSRADIAQHAWDGDNISAATRSGIGELTKKLATAVHQARDTIPARKGVVVHRPEPEGVRIEKHNGDFIVRGRVAERTVALNDITTPDAIAYVQRRLKSLGVDRALTRAGAHQGDIVHIGGFTFTYEADEL
jgi:GTP-binding protein